MANILHTVVGYAASSVETLHWNIPCFIPFLFDGGGSSDATKLESKMNSL